jgi:hypothetical protein
MEAGELILKAIQSVGFPIVVAVWLLYRTDNILRSLATAIAELSVTIKSLRKE